MNIVLFGAPGAGKGTQSANLVRELKMVQISTGDLFRKAISEGTSLGKNAQSYMDKGMLVPDSVVIDMVDEELRKLSGKADLIFDGFPRTTAQAVSLENMLTQHSLKIEKAIFLEVDTQVLLGRLTGRRVCKSCGEVYHVLTKAPKQEGVCDKCGGELWQRPDDKEDVIATRLKAYEDNTSPLKAYFLQKNMLVTVDGGGSSEEVFNRLKEHLT